MELAERQRLASIRIADREMEKPRRTVTAHVRNHAIVARFVLDLRQMK